MSVLSVYRAAAVACLVVMVMANLAPGILSPMTGALGVLFACLASWEIREGPRRVRQGLEEAARRYHEAEERAARERGAVARRPESEADAARRRAIMDAEELRRENARRAVMDARRQHAARGER